MDKKRKGKYIGIAGTVAVHLLLILLLVLVAVTVPAKEEESGVPVMLGMTEDALGQPREEFTEVDILPESVPEQAVPSPAPSAESLITQNVEKSMEVKKQKKAEKREERKVETKQPDKKKVKKPAIRQEDTKALEEQKRKEAERAAEKARIEAQKRVSSKVAGAFGKGSSISNGDTEGEGMQGVPTGNASTGKKSGIGGYGTFDLGGRSLGPGGLPRPAYNVQEEGKVVVAIIVNPSGAVVGANISPRGTTTTNASLRSSALSAAKKARFNQVSGVDNQTGTITYYFKLR